MAFKKERQKAICTKLKMVLPKYLKYYFPKTATKKDVVKRYNVLWKSKYGYKTREFTHIKRYLKK